MARTPPPPLEVRCDACHRVGPHRSRVVIDRAEVDLCPNPKDCRLHAEKTGIYRLGADLPALR